jgi:hypothetical protein
MLPTGPISKRSRFGGGSGGEGRELCSWKAPRRIEDEELASRATSGSGWIGACFGSRLRTDREGEFASRRRSGERKDRSSLRCQAREEGAERSRGSPSISTRSCQKADRACPNRRMAKAIVPGELRLSERPPGGEGSGVRVRFEPTEGEDGWLRPPSEPGDGTDESFGARSHQTLRSGSQARAGARLRKRGTGMKASALPEPAGNRPGLTAWTGPTGTDSGVRRSREPPTQRVMALPRRGRS